MTTPLQAPKLDGTAVAFRAAAYVEATTFLLLLGASITFPLFAKPGEGPLAMTLPAR